MTKPKKTLRKTKPRPTPPKPVVLMPPNEVHLLVTGRHAACFAIDGTNTRFRRKVNCPACKETDAYLLPLPGDEF